MVSLLRLLPMRLLLLPHLLLHTLLLYHAQLAWLYLTLVLWPGQRSVPVSAAALLLLSLL
jgi:hypothetical protein